LRLFGFQGSSSLPYPLPKYWGPSAARIDRVDSNTSNSTVLSSSIAPINSRVLQISEPPGTELPAADPPVFQACENCIGGEGFLCSPGFTGALCMECIPSQFSFMGRCDVGCHEIGPWPGLVNFVAIIAVVVGWLCINVLMPYESMEIALTYGSYHTVSVLPQKRFTAVRLDELVRRYMQIMTVVYAFQTKYSQQESSAWATIVTMFGVQLSFCLTLLRPPMRCS
jgi:hypothetical protein